MLYISLTPSGIFYFSNEEDEQILWLRLIMKNNVACVIAFTSIERLTELQRSCQQMVVSVFVFLVSQLGGFSIDQMKLI